MDPFTLVFLGAVAWFIKQRVRDVHYNSLARAARIEGRRTGNPVPRPPRTTHTSETLSRLPQDRRERRTARAARGARPPLDQPARAASRGSRVAAGMTMYPALLWMVPAALARGLRFGWVVGRHYRRNGGNHDEALRTATDEARRRGWRIPGLVTPTAHTDPADPTTGTTLGSSPDAGPAPASNPAPAPATITVDVLPGAHVQSPAAGGAADDITDAEIVTPSAASTTNPEGPSTMSNDITPVDIGAVASLETGDYETIIAMAELGKQAAAALAEFVAEIAQRMAQYSAAVEGLHADAASMRLDSESQGELVVYQEAIANVIEAQGRLGAEAEFLGEYAQTLQTRLRTRHGGIYDAVQDAPVSHAANSAFYGKAAV